MEPNELKKLDQIPTSNKPWYYRTPFIGIILFLISIMARIIKNYLES